MRSRAPFAFDKYNDSDGRWHVGSRNKIHRNEIKICADEEAPEMTGKRRERSLVRLLALISF